MNIAAKFSEPRLMNIRNFGFGQSKKEITMQAALRIQTKVLKGGRIEVIAPQLSIGEVVDIIILPLADTEFSGERRSVLEISDEANGHHAFRNAEDADRYLAEERSLWER